MTNKETVRYSTLSINDGSLDYVSEGYKLFTKGVVPKNQVAKITFIEKQSEKPSDNPRSNLLQFNY